MRSERSIITMMEDAALDLATDFLTSASMQRAHLITRCHSYGKTRRQQEGIEQESLVV